MTPPSAGKSAVILGTGMSVPARVVTNDDISKTVETSDEWIVTRTGIRERRVVDESQAASDLGAAAARQALERAKIAPDEVDLIILATLSPDMLSPSTGCIVQEKIGAKKAAAMDISAACSGFIYGLSLARGAIVSGEAKTVLVIGSEVTSKFVDWKDRGTCILFGDAAGAAVLREATDSRGILGTALGSDGGRSWMIDIPAGGSRAPASEATVAGRQHFLRVKGQDVFKAGVRAMTKAVREVLKKCAVTQDEVDLFIPHQANRRIIEAIADALEFPMEKVFLDLEKYGNTSAASIPVAMHEAEAEGRLKAGDIVCAVTFGAGLTWGATVIRW